MTTGNYKFAVFNKSLFVKLSGRLTYMISANFDSYIQRIVSEKQIITGIVDLGEASYLDSTNLGIIAKFAIYFLETKNEKVIIYSPDKNITVVLKAMGFDDIAEIIESYSEKALKYKDISQDSTHMRNNEEMILDAHTLLCMMNDKNRKEFQNLVEMIKSDIKQKQ